MQKIALAALFLAGMLSAAAQDYILGPNSQPHPGVPKGKVTKYTWNTSRISPGATRDYWSTCRPGTMGPSLRASWSFRTAPASPAKTARGACSVVFDNLIRQGAMPVTTYPPCPGEVSITIRFHTTRPAYQYETHRIRLYFFT